ncbi:MAG: M48 family metalloprotease [Halioglobus sp.]
MLVSTRALFSLTTGKQWLAPFLLSLVLVPGCATSVISPEMEGELGAEQSREVEDQIGLYEDDDLEKYVKAVGLRLVADLGYTPYTFHFAIVDQHEPNAFASLGGYIYISRGLLVQMNSEAELAGVLAHEISHVTQRHHTRQVGRSVGAGLLTLPGKAVGIISEDLGNIINTPIEAVGNVYLSSYSRGQETEADEYGMALAAKSGYEPMALVSALEGLERSAENLTGEHHEASFFDSHPTTPTRVADIKDKAGSLPRNPRAPIATDAQLAQRMEGLWWGPQNPQQGVFQGQVYLNADFDFRLAFAEEWKTVNSPRFVGASAADGGAYIALGGGDPEHTVTELANALQTKMEEGAGIHPSERRQLSIGEWPAELIRYDDQSGGETVSLFYLFVSVDGLSFTVMSMGYERYRETLKETVLSLRQLTAAERESIGGLRVRLAEVRPGETFTSFGQRVGNEWPAELTGIINGAADNATPVAGSRLKLVRTERYMPQ